jgi:hypothetical protein
MDVLFSNRSFVFSNNSNLDHHHHHHLSRNNDTANNNTNNTTTADTGACNGNGHNNNYQAVNFCPNCKTAYYFRPDKIAPLQGSFVEIGRISNKGNGKNGNKGGKEGSNGGEEGADYANVTNTINNRLRVSFWETLRSYGGDPPENWPQGIPPPPPRVGMGWLCIRLLVRRLLRGLAWLGLLSQVEKRVEVVVGMEVVRRMVLDGVGQIWGRNCRRQRRFAKVLISLLLDKTEQKRFAFFNYISFVFGFLISLVGIRLQSVSEFRCL